LFLTAETSEEFKITLEAYILDESSFTPIDFKLISSFNELLFLGEIETILSQKSISKATIP